MKSTPDLSIGQRLAIGFGLILITIALLIAVVLRWQAQSAAVQAEYEQRIDPLRMQSRELERRISQVAVRVRSVLLERTAERLASYETASGETRAALQRLDQLPMESDGARQMQVIGSETRAYLLAADALAARGPTDMSDTAEELALGGMRIALLAKVERFASLQEAKARQALAQIAATREQTTRGMVTGSALAMLVLIAFAYLTARSISRPTKALLRTAGALESGDWKPALRMAPAPARPGEPMVRDEMRRLGNAFGSAAVALERRQERLRADGEVAKAIASSLDRGQICNAALQDILRHVQAEIGVVYGVDASNDALQPIATYALDRDAAALRIGEGAPGQAAVDRRMIVIRDIPTDSGFDVKLGVDRAPPKMIAAIPLLFRDELHGVLLVGSLRELSSDAIEFLQAAAGQLGVGMNNVDAYERIQMLLGQLRERSEEVQAQNEELQVQNEEIQAQNEEIQAQSQQLQVQHEEMQAQNEELKQQSEELRSHAALLAEADERKNKFLGVLAHELRNPMAPISNSIFILKHSHLESESARQARDIIERQSQHLVRLIDDLLDVTRISEGKIHVQRQPMNLVEVVRVCIEDHVAAFEQAGIELELDLPNTPVGVNGDHTRLCQVLGNLLHNTLKFSDRGDRVMLSLRVDHAHKQAVLRIVDTGVGMDATLLPKLFQPFSQGESGLARTNGGLGLGLALVKALVMLHDGSVEALSDGPGKGAEFIIRLPLAPAQQLDEQERASSSSVNLESEPATIESGAGGRILIIEDNRDAACSLQAALQLQGYEVAVAFSGTEGLSAAAAFRPDLVLCDVGLPELDGYEVARQLRADPQLRSVLLIALTGYAAEKDRDAASAAGFDLHLAKPLQLSALASILARVRRTGVAGADEILDEPG